MAESELMNSSQSKADDAYKTISEVAGELDVPQHVLRFWETHFPQVKPSRMRGSRRYYRPEDVALLKKIKTLLYAQGYTIKGAKKFIKEGANPAVAPVETAAPVAVKPAKKTSKADTQLIVSELRVLKTMLAALV
jgi:DNA-binding transcriptional MerR regulator